MEQYNYHSYFNYFVTRYLWLGFVIFILPMISLANSEVQTQSITSIQQQLNKQQQQDPLIIPSAPDIDAKSYVLMDYNTGQIIAQKKAHKKHPPASLTKLMTLYITFKALNSGLIAADDQVPISKKAWKTGGSRMFVEVGNHVPVKDLIQGIIVDSGNDATVALAQYIGGSTKAFVKLMNQQAQRLGMKHTHFTDVEGLPAKKHYSSAHDLALLTRVLINKFPKLYHWFDDKHFVWDDIKQSNRNWLLWRDSSVDGLKTGHTKDAGYCLVSSAKRKGMRLIAVVLGAPTENSRISDSEQLLNYGFHFFKTHKIYDAKHTITHARVWGGAKSNVNLGLANDLYVTIPKGQYQDLKIDVQLNQTLHAPIKKGQTYGKLSIHLHDKKVAEKPIVALQNDPQGGLWTRFIDMIRFQIQQWL